MKNEKRHEAKELISSIRNILFNDWDPLNVSTAINADDEYDYLIGQVMTLLTGISQMTSPCNIPG